MTFSITLGPRTLHEDGEPLMEGRIVVGNLTETFLSSLSYWSAANYKTQWETALRNLVSGEVEVACLVTTTPPPEVHGPTWLWVLYLKGRKISVQNRLVIPGETGPGIDLDHPCATIGAFTTTNAEGRQISTWEVDLADVAKFLGD